MFVGCKWNWSRKKRRLESICLAFAYQVSKRDSVFSPFSRSLQASSSYLDGGKTTNVGDLNSVIVHHDREDQPLN